MSVSRIVKITNLGLSKKNVKTHPNHDVIRMDSDFISLTIDDVYRFQKFLASHSVTLMADNHKLPCICMD